MKKGDGENERGGRWGQTCEEISLFSATGADDVAEKCRQSFLSQMAGAYLSSTFTCGLPLSPNFMLNMT